MLQADQKDILLLRGHYIKKFEMKIRPIKSVRLPVFLAVVLIFCNSILAFSQEDSAVKLYVAKYGKDSNSGTKEKPYASPSAALLHIAKLKKKSPSIAVELRILKGHYYIDQTLVIGPAMSGNKKAPFTLKAEPGEEVVWSGARILKLNWQQASSGLWHTQVPDGLTFQSLFVDGKPLIRARYPNYDTDVLPFNGYAEDAISTQRVKSWNNPQNAIVHALHEGRWGGFHYRVTGKNEQGDLELEGGLQNNRPSKMHKTYRFVENVFEELDADNEWFLDERTSTLYFKAPGGQNPNRQKFEAPVLESILTLSGTETNPVHDVNVQGIHFTHTSPTFMKTEEPLLRSDWTIYRQAAVKIEGSERCQIENSNFTDLGGNAIFVSNYNRNVRLAGNLIERVGAGGINFVGNPDAVRSPSFRYEKFVPESEIDTVAGPKSNNYPAECEVSDNLIRNIGLIEKQVAGIQIAMASRISVLHNTIYDVPRAGINIGDGSWGGHDIAFNDVFRTVLETSDHGAFNSWGRDRFWHPDRQEMDRITAAHPNWVKLDAVETTRIRENRFQCDHGWDIDLDDGSTNYAIYNNLCLSGGLKLREGFYRTVFNNLILNNGFHPHVWFKDSHDVFRTNIVMNAHQDIQVKFWGDTVDYNFYTNPDDLIKDQTKGIEIHGSIIDLTFNEAATGDFELNSGNLKNFSKLNLEDVGVKSPRLKAITDAPQIPAVVVTDPRTTGELFTWSGGTFKSIESLGEQSAAGLPSMEGVLVVELSPSSPLIKGGLQPGDVILEFQSEQIKNVRDLARISKRDNYVDSLILFVFRNQEKLKIQVKR